MTTETAQEWAARLSAADVEAIFHAALQKHDMQGVVHALRLLAVKDPRRAQELYDLIQVGLQLRDASPAALISLADTLTTLAKEKTP